MSIRVGACGKQAGPCLVLIFVTLYAGAGLCMADDPAFDVDAYKQLVAEKKKETVFGAARMLWQYYYEKGEKQTADHWWNQGKQAFANLITAACATRHL